MRFEQVLLESAASELAKKLPSLEKHDYTTIDKLMRGIAKKHQITGKALHNLFIKKYHIYHIIIPYLNFIKLFSNFLPTMNINHFLF